MIPKANEDARTEHMEISFPLKLEGKKKLHDKHYYTEYFVTTNSFVCEPQNLYSLDLPAH